MQAKCSIALLAGILVSSVVLIRLLAVEKTVPGEQRDRLLKAIQAGNYKEAYEGLRKLALDPLEDARLVGDDLVSAIECLHHLGRVEEVDAFREAVIAVHKNNWRLLQAAAQSLVGDEHNGCIVAGKFHRGYRRGTGRWVNSVQRDRVRALQLLEQAIPRQKGETDHKALADFHAVFAEVLRKGGGYHPAWRLQVRTDLAKLPDFDEGHYYGGESRGAPVDEQGNPVYYQVPKSDADARSDGERWRWHLAQIVTHAPDRVSQIDLIFAGFLQGQFDVQTMEGREAKTGVFAVHTLQDDETIARLATGVKRFKVPDEFNWIKILERVAGRGKSKWGGQAREALARVYENRRQFAKAAAVWKKAIAEYGPGDNNYRQRELEQITGNWGRFESANVQPAGVKSTVDFRFRNGTRVAFEAHAIQVEKLLEDVKAYLRSNPGQVEWNRIHIGDIGYQLVTREQKQYVGDKVASWELELKPRPAHVDDRVTVQTPLDKPGAYLVTGKMANGNVSQVILWISDTAIVQKHLDGQDLWYFADAVTGQPIDQADVEFFGYRQEQVAPNTNKYRVLTQAFHGRSDKDGQLIVGDGQVSHQFQWLVTARKASGGRQAPVGQGGRDRFAYFGFSNTWYGRQHDPEYHATKVFTITDRPVYRPQQKVQFKIWVRHTKYDQPDTSDFAGRQFTVRINNPRGEKVIEQAYTTDAYGGIAGEYALPKDAMLGAYQMYLLNEPHQGRSTFRVEEYKKPEFEVKVEAPREPVMLGEKIQASIEARYYFGAPVTKAKVKYKVLRTTHDSRWYPVGTWDWFYGPGYWWFAADYNWYPGFSRWGCLRPWPWWWGHGGEQPEVVLENEVEIGPDGKVRVPIDTLAAKELHGDQDHQYSITAEVVDESRRTITGTGQVLVARQPFRVFAWVDHGHYRVGDTIQASFNAHTLDHKPVQGKGELTLYRISYNDKAEPVEKAVQTWKLDTNAEGQARQQLVASAAGQYRLSYQLTDSKDHTIEGGYVFVVRGEGFDGKAYRFNDLELITDKREYAPGEKVKLLLNTDRKDSTVLLFLRPSNNVYLPPKMLRLNGKSIEEEVAVVQRDMPNFFIEALTVSNGKVHTEVREVIVPPEKRVLNVEVLPSQQEYLPGQKATVKVKVTDLHGKRFEGSTVLTLYDRSVEYISGGSNVPEIKGFFWKWRRHHYPSSSNNLERAFGNLVPSGEVGMGDLGVFGAQVIDTLACTPVGKENRLQGRSGGFGGAMGGRGEGMNLRGLLDEKAAAPRSEAAARAPGAPPGKDKDASMPAGPGQSASPGVEPTVRKNFADTAFWTASLQTDRDGLAEVSLTMPENLTGWKVKVWAMGHGTKVGEGSAEVTTKKNLLVRLQAPRFFVEKDEVVLSANVHNYLKTDKKVQVSLELDGKTLEVLGSPAGDVMIAAGGEKRVDWRVKVKAEGEAIVRMKAVSDEESDAVEMRFPCYVHGMLKMDSFARVIRPDRESAQVIFTVPAQRRVNDTRLEVRWSPTLAGALVDALPYLVDYPYGCTEQTLNRFLPTVITQHVLQRMNLDLKQIQKKRTNFNAQEIGDPQARAKGWQRYDRNPVFDEGEVQAMVHDGIQKLQNMQLSDGGWGWFSGYGEQSGPHTTAVVVHGLQLARENGVVLPAGMMEAGITWLQGYQNREVQKLKNFPTRTQPHKEFADNLDALVYLVLADQAHLDNDMKDMRDFLYRDRTQLAVYAKALFGLALHQQASGGREPAVADKLAMILKNIEQFVVEDEENQTAYLRLPQTNPWWYWYGSEVEANAWYLKLLSRTNPRDQRASRLVKYLLNNRKHATYWNSTRDTAVAIEALADYLKASGEDRPDMTVEVWLDGQKHKEVKIDAGNLFTFDGSLVLQGDAVSSGKHTLEIRKKGTGPVYFNAYVTNFTLEDFLTKAGLEVKVERKVYKLVPVDKKIKTPGSRGQAVDQKVEKYERQELANLAQLKSGDLVEVELEIDSKNDYEYLVFEDYKAAGFEPLLVRSGYNANDLGAYMELRDDRVCFFVRVLARGKHSVSYRMRAEIPGKFSALPARASAMYAPELKGNSDEIKLVIED